MNDLFGTHKRAFLRTRDTAAPGGPLREEAVMYEVVFLLSFLSSKPAFLWLSAAKKAT